MDWWIVASVVVPLVVTAVIIVAVTRGVRRMSGVEGGVPATALLRGFSETGTTISSAYTGPDAPVYRLDLLVSPPDGPPFEAQVKQPVPRIVLPFFVPGIQVPVDLDPTNPSRVTVAFRRFQAGTPGGAAAGGPGVTLSFAADGSLAPVGGMDELSDAVRQGTLPTTTGSAAELLATGARGTAEVTQARPLGKRIRDVFPDPRPEVADDPIWMLSLTVQLPDEAPFPAVVGHRVPRDRVADVVPGLRVPVAVDLADRHGKVAIDWDAVPA